MFAGRVSTGAGRSGPASGVHGRRARGRGHRSGRVVLRALAVAVLAVPAPVAGGLVSGGDSPAGVGPEPRLVSASGPGAVMSEGVVASRRSDADVKAGLGRYLYACTGGGRCGD